MIFLLIIKKFCENVVTELADISLGDAWLEPYSKEGRGTSVVVTRSPLAEEIIQDGIKNAAISIETISPDTMRASQQGSYNHRHQGLYVRLKEAKKSGIPIAEKRYGKTAVPLDVALVQKLRRSSRKKSLDVWPRTQSAELFDQEMQSILSSLKLATKITHIKRMGHKRIIERLYARIMRRK
jgi:coenzyme F420-reducing hydrogenase beta subunit